MTGKLEQKNPPNGIGILLLECSRKNQRIVEEIDGVKRTEGRVISSETLGTAQSHSGQ